MKKMSEPIVFFGSGPVAAESLRLLQETFNIEAVVTKPRPPHHRGIVPVIALAEKLGLPIYTVSNGKELNDVIAARPFKSRVAVLIDFGIIVSQKVIDYFPLGIVNSHFSLLPEWRGADPITFAILSGQKQTGVSLMLLVEAMDEGPLLAFGVHDLAPDVTTPELTDYLIKLSYGLLRDVMSGYLAGDIKPIPQDRTGNKVSYSRRLVKEDGIIDWQKPAVVIEREIRAFKGWPQSRTRIRTLDGIITKAHVIDAKGTPGESAIISKQLVIYCGEQALVIDRIKPAGKKEMTGQAFLAGYRQFIA